MENSNSNESASTPELTDLAICASKFLNKLDDVNNVHERAIVHKHLKRYNVWIDDLASAKPRN